MFKRFMTKASRSRAGRGGPTKVALAVAVVAAGTLLAGPALGVPLGGKWPSPTYTYWKNLNGYSGYDTPATNAGHAWNSATRFTIGIGTAANAPVALNVDAYGTTDWFGMGVPGPQYDSGTYTYGTIKINASWLNTGHFNCANPGGAKCDYPADNASQKQCVIAHEMGHVTGLAHTADTANKIMNPDHGVRCHTKALTGPTSGDAADINDIY